MRLFRPAAIARNGGSVESGLPIKQAEITRTGGNRSNRK